MIDFGTIKGITIPEGIVKQIMHGETLLWQKSSGAKLISYTGDYTESLVEIDGVAYTLYTLTTSGTLTVEGEGILFWMCGGGSGGGDAYGTISSWNGTGGSGGHPLQGMLPAGEYAVVIGAGGKGKSGDTEGNPGSATKIGSAFTAEGGEDITSGASGGGVKANITKNSYQDWVPMTGEGVSTLPFGLSELGPHCAGGASGGIFYKGETQTRSATGSNGGSNGSKATKIKFGSTESAATGGKGGDKGGGKGGDGDSSSTNKDGADATFFGSGGGGGGNYFKYSSSGSHTSRKGVGGAGYQGVLYIAIPA